MKRFTKKEIAAWPKQHRACTKCDRVKSFEDFHAHAGAMFGINPVCRECRGSKTRNKWNLDKENPDYQVSAMLRRASERAVKHGREFDLSPEDVVVPDVCPVFGTPLRWGSDDPKCKPSIDRIDSDNGYVPGNVAVISWRANTLKNNGTADEFQAIADWLKSLEPTEAVDLV